ncbi:MAG: Holliday junction branch migration protein RuvA [Bifidobacteriaceae bacterium]|nr:Holliday junction branch migration protein RuvA [Bifidobacteriaceae bacterium]
MIASLRGTVLALTASGAVVECGGVGLAVTVTPGGRDRLRQGEEGFLPTHLVVREDSLTLYGFADAAERDVFVAVQSASGVGPRLALALVSTLGADGLVKAVAAEDLTALAKVPGVGKRSAQKLVLALGGKLARPGGGLGAGLGGAGAAGGAAGRLAGDAASQVQAALESLGWDAGAAADGIGQVLAQAEAPTDVPGLLRAALRTLGARR